MQVARWRIPEIVLGALLAVAIFAVGTTVGSSQVSTPPIEQQSAAKADQKGDANRANVSFWPWDATTTANILIAIFTGLLVATAFIQNRGLKRANEIAGTAAKAADLSAKAAIAIQLPIVRANPSSLGYGISRTDGVEREHCSVHYVDYSNLGPTKAFPIEIQCGWTIGGVLPSDPKYVEIIYVDDPHFILEPAPAEPFRAFLRFNIPLKSDEWSLICEGKLKVWFYCIFVYEDFMRTRHNAGFCWCWKYVGMGNAWRVDDTPAYNRHT